MEMITSMKGNCKFSNMVNCFGAANCTNCGWNPVVKQVRVKNFLKEMALESKKRPKYCPMQDTTVIDQKQKFGVVMRCFNSNCQPTPNGACRALSEMLEYWTGRCGLQVHEPPEKVEITHEQSN